MIRRFGEAVQPQRATSKLTSLAKATQICKNLLLLDWQIAFGGKFKRYEAERTKRLPGFTAALPPRHSGQSSAS